MLGIMRDNVEISQLHPEDTEPMITMRRGFHTLKGSGRMVGLTELGEVAWACERALQKCVQDRKQASAGLLQFIVDATQAFSGWVADLEKQGCTLIDAAGLVERARQIESGIDGPVAEQKPEQTQESGPVPEAHQEMVVEDRPETAGQAQTVAEPEPLVEPVVHAEQEAVPADDFAEPQSIVIGEIALPPTLFKIASEEASQNVATLHYHFASFMATQPRQVVYDFMRAAHTLAGICRSLGFMSVVQLSAAVEGWLQANIDGTEEVSPEQEKMLEEAIAALDEMVQRICAREMPQAHDELVQRVQADKDRIIGEREEIAPSEEIAAVLAKTHAAHEHGAEAQMESLPAEDQTAESVLQADEDVNETLREMHAEEPAQVKSAHVRGPMLRDDLDEQLLPIFLDEAD